MFSSGAKSRAKLGQIQFQESNYTPTLVKIFHVHGQAIPRKRANITRWWDDLFFNVLTFTAKPSKARKFGSKTLVRTFVQLKRPSSVRNSFPFLIAMHTMWQSLSSPGRLWRENSLVEPLCVKYELTRPEWELAFSGSLVDQRKQKLLRNNN